MSLESQDTGLTGSLVYTASSGDSQGEWADMVKAGVGSEVGRGLFHEAINQESDALEGGQPGK